MGRTCPDCPDRYHRRYTIPHKSGEGGGKVRAPQEFTTPVYACPTSCPTRTSVPSTASRNITHSPDPLIDSSYSWSLPPFLPCFPSLHSPTPFLLCAPRPLRPTLPSCWLELIPNSFRAYHYFLIIYLYCWSPLRPLFLFIAPREVLRTIRR